MLVNAINDLRQHLQQKLGSLDISHLGIDGSSAMQKAVEEIKKVFNGYASASAPAERAYNAARKYLLRQNLRADEYDFMTAALHVPVRDINQQRVIDSENFTGLLQYYERRFSESSMGRLSWYWLFLSYFSIDIDNANNEISQKNIENLRRFLHNTHTRFTESQDFLPEWAKLLREHTNILSDKPCDRYAEAYLRENYNEINAIIRGFSIPNTSWFWHQLTLSIVRYVTGLKNDADFKQQIPSLINFLEKHKGYRDEAIKLILERFYQCADKSPHNQLRDYLIRPDVWRNPKLRNTGIASKWRHVDENVWRMVFNWVNHEHLRLFFEIISGRHGARKDRFEFWSQYIEQITFTKLVFGATTQRQKQLNPEIRKLFVEEEGVYAALTSNNEDLDAFIIQIENYIFVEFSMNGNAAFIYKINEMQFNLNDRKMNDKAYGNGLKAAQQDKIIHNHNWQVAARSRLMKLGIYPDRPKN